MKRFIIDIELFNRKLHVVTDCTQDELIAWVKKKFGAIVEKHNCNGKMLELFNDNNRNVVYVIWVEKFQWSCAQQGLMAHEIYHLVSHLCRDSNVEEVSATEEVRAIVYQNIFVDVWWNLSRDKRKRKK